MKIKMEVKGLMVDPVTNMPMVVLRAEGESHVLPIWVGVFEANAIALEVEGIRTPRPMTHDLLRAIIQELSATVVEAVVCDLKDSTYHARLRLETPGGMIDVDARPSDAIALALRAGAPIFGEEGVIEKARAFDVITEDPDKVQTWFDGLGDEELGTYEM